MTCAQAEKTNLLRQEGCARDAALAWTWRYPGSGLVPLSPRVLRAGVWVGGGVLKTSGP